MLGLLGSIFGGGGMAPGGSYGPSGPQRSQQSMQARGLAQMMVNNNNQANAMVPNPYNSGTTGATGGPGQLTRLYTFINSATTTTSTNAVIGSAGQVYWQSNDVQLMPLADPTKIVVPDGERREIKLPDGTLIEVARDGSFVIKDQDAKVTYRANRVREFNAFLNASDKLEEFIRFCGAHGARKQETLDIPIQLFIQWLIIEAAKADHEESPEDIPLIPDLRKAVTQPRCTVCQRFIPRIARQRRVEICSTRCFERLAA